MHVLEQPTTEPATQSNIYFVTISECLQGLQNWFQFLHFRSECNTKGGTSDGTCASGFGVCCTL